MLTELLRFFINFLKPIWTPFTALAPPPISVLTLAALRWWPNRASWARWVLANELYAGLGRVPSLAKACAKPAAESVCRREVRSNTIRENDVRGR